MIIFYDSLITKAIKWLCIYKFNEFNKKVLSSGFIEEFACELKRPALSLDPR